MILDRDFSEDGSDYLRAYILGRFSIFHLSEYLIKLSLLTLPCHLHLKALSDIWAMNLRHYIIAIVIACGIAAATNSTEYDYVIIGSGPGGGSLA